MISNGVISFREQYPNGIWRSLTETERGLTAPYFMDSSGKTVVSRWRLKYRETDGRWNLSCIPILSSPFLRISGYHEWQISTMVFNNSKLPRKPRVEKIMNPWSNQNEPMAINKIATIQTVTALVFKIVMKQDYVPFRPPTPRIDVVLNLNTDWLAPASRPFEPPIELGISILENTEHILIRKNDRRIEGSLKWI
jgi:hypothetical protein